MIGLHILERNAGMGGRGEGLTQKKKKKMAKQTEGVAVRAGRDITRSGLRI